MPKLICEHQLSCQKFVPQHAGGDVDLIATIMRNPSLASAIDRRKERCNFFGNDCRCCCGTSNHKGQQVKEVSPPPSICKHLSFCTSFNPDSSDSRTIEGKCRFLLRGQCCCTGSRHHLEVVIDEEE